MNTRSTSRRRRQRQRRAFTLFSAASLLAMAIILIIHAIWPASPATPVQVTPSASASATPAETPTPTPTPATAAEALLATTTDPNTCAVTFVGADGPVDLPPMLQTQGLRYESLPIPSRDGSVFAGWYATAADATAYTVAARVNGADLVSCADRQITLYGSFQTAEQAAAVDVGVPILMYHQFTTDPAGEAGWLKGNYAYIEDVRAHWEYIATGGFYLPTWDELNAFIDGRLVLPARSVIVTDDDADPTWFELAVPIVDAARMLTTSFVITGARQDGTPSVWVQQRSHTHDMHTAGDDGRGRIVNYTLEQIVTDLQESARILGAAEVVAYPFGHYDDQAKQGVAQAGFELAVTIEPGTVHVGADKLALPRVRVNYGTTLEDLKGMIG